MLVVICDDSRKDRETLVVYCSRYKKEKRLPISIMEFTSADDLLQRKEARKADVILMDIYIGSSS